MSPARLRTRGSGTVAGLLLAAALSASTPLARGTEASPTTGDDVAAAELPQPNPANTFPIDDANPSGSLPGREERAKRPLEYGYMLMEMTGRGEEALEAQDFARAARYFEALAVAVPEVAVGHRKLCISRSAAGDLDGAVSACRQATKSEGSQSGDLSRLLAALLARPAALSPEELSEFDQVLAHARSQGVDTSELLPLSCELGLRMRDDARLDACVTELAALAPGAAPTISFTWALAMRRGNEAGARKALEQARAASLDPKKVAEMEATTTKAFGSSRPWAIGGIAVALVAGLAALVMARRGSKPKPPLVHATPAKG